MRAWELYENSDYDGGGWLNVKSKTFIPTKGCYHVLAIFHNMEKFGLTPEKMKSIPAFSKWFELDWANITGNNDPEDLKSWWMDLDPHGKIPTLSGNGVEHNADGNEYLLDGDMEIIEWMNNQGWVRTIRHKDMGKMETSIQGKDLKQIQRAANFFDKEYGIETLYYDTNNLRDGKELNGYELNHFLKYGNINFRKMDEGDIVLSNAEKQWINPSSKNLVVVSSTMHHTQMAHASPEKFGLSGNLFKDYEYPIDDNGKPAQFDVNVATKMFDAGWVRTRTSAAGFGMGADVHCIELNVAAMALRMLKEKFNHLSVATIELGYDTTPTNTTHELRNDENGRGPLKTFMKTGKIVKPSRMNNF